MTAQTHATTTREVTHTSVGLRVGSAARRLVTPYAVSRPHHPATAKPKPGVIRCARDSTRQSSSAAENPAVWAARGAGTRLSSGSLAPSPPQATVHQSTHPPVTSHRPQMAARCSVVAVRGRSATSPAQSPHTRKAEEISLWLAMAGNSPLVMWWSPGAPHRWNGGIASPVDRRRPG